MKRCFSLVLVLLMVFSMTACGHNMDKTSDKPIKEPTDGQNVTISQTEVPVDDSGTAESTVIESVGEEQVLPDFTYVMAKLHETVTDDYTELWFVLECLHYDFGLVVDDEFLVVNSLTGDEISELGERRDTDYKYEVYTGNVCVNDHAVESRFYWGHSDDDARQYVVKIRSVNPIGFDDLQITANPYYNGGVGVDLVDPIVVDFNAEMSDITTQQDYIHGNTLFELDGKYYLSVDDSGIGGEFYGSGVGVIVDFVYITGTPNDLLNSFNNKVMYVYDSLQDDLCLSAVPTPEGAVVSLCLDETPWVTSILFGYVTDGVTTVDEDAIDDISFDITPVYHFDDGRTMTFLFI